MNYNVVTQVNGGTSTNFKMSFARIPLNISLPVQWVLRYPFPGIKRPGREADH
jgi:hypothetical protein